MRPNLDQISPRQRELLHRWLPDAEVIKDHSWGIVGTTVLELRTPDGATFIAKSGDSDDRHLAREILAHRQWLAAWTSLGRAPGLVHGDEEAKLLLATFQPGQIVEGTSHEYLVATIKTRT